MFRQIIVLKFFVSYENCAMHGNFPFHIPLSLSLKKTENKFKNKTPPQYPNASRKHKTALSGNKKYFKAINLDGSYYKQTSDTHIDGDNNWKRLQ